MFALQGHALLEDLSYADQFELGRVLKTLCQR